MTDTGKTIRSVREFRGLSQGALSVRAGLTKHAVYLIEAGRRKPRIGTVAAIAKALDVPTEDLIETPDDLSDSRCWWPVEEAFNLPNCRPATKQEIAQVKQVLRLVSGL